MEGFGAGIFIPKTFVSLQLTKNKCANLESDLRRVGVGGRQQQS